MRRDRSGEPFQTDFTDDNSEPSATRSEDVAETLKGDPDVDSQEDDAAMSRNAFGEDEPPA